tara:strand:+ start:616 stop:861 length:246 start_codon:yes stop_codon:yes gene_type:complete
MVKKEWRKTSLKALNRLIHRPVKKKRWRWAKVGLDQKVKVHLVDPHGRLWEFKLQKGVWVRPAWLQNEPSPRETSVCAANR